jgi:hypothetical protein
MLIYCGKSMREEEGERTRDGGRGDGEEGRRLVGSISTNQPLDINWTDQRVEHPVNKGVPRQEIEIGLI